MRTNTMPGDISIDNLQIQIESDSSKASSSLDNLVKSLDGLEQALGKIDGKVDVVNQLSSALHSLASVNLKTGGITTFTSALARLGKQAEQVGRLENVSKVFRDVNSAMSQMSGANVKTNGVSSLVNAVARLSRDKVNVDQAADAVGKLSTSLASFQNMYGVGETATGVSKMISSFSRLTTNMGDAKFAANIPEATQAIRDFFTEMANMPQVSDNTVRMAEALAQMGRSGRNAGDSLQTTAKSTTSLETATVVVESFGKGIKSLITLFKKLGTASGKALSELGKGLKSITSAGIKKIRELHTNLKNMGSASGGIKSITQHLKTLLGVVIGFRGITGVFNWLKESVSAGADVAEVNHIIESTFGDLADSVKVWSKSAITNYGIAETAAKRYAGTLSAMFQASGVASETAAQMSLDLVGLAGDLSSFFNIDTETAYNKIKSGMAGMVRPLRDLGIDLTAATLKEYALEQGITKSYTAMTQAEKVMLRYKYLLEVTQKQQGDFSRTSGKLNTAA